LNDAVRDSPAFIDELAKLSARIFRLKSSKPHFASRKEQACCLIRGLLLESAGFPNLRSKFLNPRDDPTLLCQRRKRDPLLEKGVPRKRTVPTGAAGRDPSEQFYTLRRFEIGDEKIEVQLVEVTSKAWKAVRTYHSLLRFTHPSDSTFPRKNDVKNEVARLQPEDPLGSEFMT